jgi:hypothetical protein
MSVIAKIGVEFLGDIAGKLSDAVLVFAHRYIVA